ncbi:MAG: hypothetical protein NUW24_07515 [Anaerolineae bacterium]|jgi:hypothetical protein|nr:hypothetical protein [Anaerolineae bacterium]MDH7472918.1 hypothetical protein [Anaerolineae bacterium]
MSPAKKKGTFADLYEAERRVRPARAGRPRSLRQRKQTTIYLTPEQKEILNDLHYAWSKRFKVDRSDIVGLSIDMLARMVSMLDTSEFQTFESLKVQISRNIDSGFTAK